MKKRTPFQSKEKFLSGTSFLGWIALVGEIALPSPHLHLSLLALE